MATLTVEQIKAVFKRSRRLFSEEQVEQAIAQMAEKITAIAHDQNPILLCIMNGGLITTGKLAPLLDFPLQIDYLHATRYRDKTTGSDLEWKKTPSLSLKGRVVLLVDDILDEGATLAHIIKYCNDEGAEKVVTVVLTDKLHDRKVEGVSADVVGLEVEDAYVFGYGMDYKSYFRNAAGIFAIAQSDY